jgi:hypothetical protein
MVGAGTTELSGTALGDRIDNRMPPGKSFTRDRDWPPLFVLDRQQSGPVGCFELPTASKSITL